MGETTPSMCKLKAQTKVLGCLDGVEKKYESQSISRNEVMPFYSKCLMSSVAETNNISIRELGACLQ
jgi:hypothetical protein